MRNKFMNVSHHERSKVVLQNTKKTIDIYGSFILAAVIVWAACSVADLAMRDQLLLTTIKDVINGLTTSIINLT